MCAAGDFLESRRRPTAARLVRHLTCGEREACLVYQMRETAPYEWKFSERSLLRLRSLDSKSLLPFTRKGSLSRFCSCCSCLPLASCSCYDRRRHRCSPCRHEDSAPLIPRRETQAANCGNRDPLIICTCVAADADADAANAFSATRGSSDQSADYG